MSSPYYAPSGRLPARAVVLASVCALAVLVPAWLYAWLTIHSPFVLINWIAMAAFAVTMGVGAQMAARLGKARNPVWVGRLGQLFSILNDCPEADPMRYSAITLYRGATDPFISIDNVSIEPSANKEKKSTRAVVTYLRSPNMDADGLIAHCLPAAAPGPASETPEDAATAALAGAAPHIAAGRDDLRIDALRLCAFATARLSRWTEAQHYWNALFDEERSAFNASQTGCNLAMTGDLEQAGEWIARARELNAATREMPDSQIVTSYISALTQAGHPARAMPYLDELRTLYMRQGCTDATVLAARRIPLFGIFLQNSLSIVRKVLGDAEGRAWYAAMAAHLDQAGQGDLASWLEASFAGETSTTS